MSHVAVSVSCTCPDLAPALTFTLPTRPMRQLDRTDAAAPPVLEEHHICRGCGLPCDMDYLSSYSVSLCLTEENDVHPLCNAKLYLRDTNTTAATAQASAQASATASSHTSPRRKLQVNIPYCKRNLQCRHAALNWFQQYMFQIGVGKA